MEQKFSTVKVSDFFLSLDPRCLLKRAVSLDSLDSLSPQYVFSYEFILKQSMCFDDLHTQGLIVETGYLLAAAAAQNPAASKGGARADLCLRRTQLQKDNKLLPYFTLLTSHSKVRGSKCFLA